MSESCQLHSFRYRRDIKPPRSVAWVGRWSTRGRCREDGCRRMRS